MTAKKNTSGIRLYNLLKKEAYAANKSLLKPLPAQKVDKLIKQVLFPSWQGYAVSRIRKGELRADIAKALKKATPKKNKALQLYGKLLHEASELNQQIPEHQRLTLPELRKLVSEKIYPVYKGKAISKIDKGDVKKILGKELQALQRTVCDILAIQESSYANINYFDLDHMIDGVFPRCIYVEIIAGDFGRTDIFNTKGYDYYDSGLQKITNNINQSIRAGDLNGGTSSVPVYVGNIQLRPGKKNDGKSENYYLEFTLYIDESPVEEPEDFTPPKRKLTAKQKKSDQKVRNYVKENFKSAKFKSKTKGIVKRVADVVYKANKSWQAYKSLPRSIRPKIAAMKQWEQTTFKTEKKKLDADKEKKLIKQEQYKELLAKLKRAFNQ